MADVLSGIARLLEALTDRAAPVILSSPVYNAFFTVIDSIGRKPLDAPLTPDGRLDPESLAGRVRAQREGRPSRLPAVQPAQPHRHGAHARGAGRRWPASRTTTASPSSLTRSMPPWCTSPAPSRPTSRSPAPRRRHGDIRLQGVEPRRSQGRPHRPRTRSPRSGRPPPPVRHVRREPPRCHRARGGPPGPEASTGSSASSRSSTPTATCSASSSPTSCPGAPALPEATYPRLARLPGARPR